MRNFSNIEKYKKTNKNNEKDISLKYEKYNIAADLGFISFILSIVFILISFIYNIYELSKITGGYSLFVDIFLSAVIHLGFSATFMLYGYWVGSRLGDIVYDKEFKKTNISSLVTSLLYILVIIGLIIASFITLTYLYTLLPLFIGLLFLFLGTTLINGVKEYDNHILFIFAENHLNKSFGRKLIYCLDYKYL